jgi:hypothetical protein
MTVAELVAELQKSKYDASATVALIDGPQRGMIHGEVKTVQLVEVHCIDGRPLLSTHPLNVSERAHYVYRVIGMGVAP